MNDSIGTLSKDFTFTFIARIRLDNKLFKLLVIVFITDVSVFFTPRLVRVLDIES